MRLKYLTIIFNLLVYYILRRFNWPDECCFYRFSLLWKIFDMNLRWCSKLNSVMQGLKAKFSVMVPSTKLQSLFPSRTWLTASPASPNLALLCNASIYSLSTTLRLLYCQKNFIHDLLCHPFTVSVKLRVNYLITLHQPWKTPSFGHIIDAHNHWIQHHDPSNGSYHCIILRVKHA